MDLALTAEADTFAEQTVLLDRGVGIRIYCIVLDAAVAANAKDAAHCSKKKRRSSRGFQWLTCAQQNYY